MRKLWLVCIIVICFVFPAAVYAQEPDPPPSVLQVCLDEGWGACWERVREDFGLVGAVIVVFLIAVLIPAVRKRLQEMTENVVSKNPFGPGIGLRRYLEVFIAENRVFGFRGTIDYQLRPIDLTNAYIQLDLNFSKLAEREARNKGGDDDAAPEKTMMRQAEKMQFSLMQILGAGYKKIVIVGDAGSGKSALMQWAGMTAAQAYLFRKVSAEQKTFLKAIGFNLIFRRYLPLLVPLRKFYAHCMENKLPVDSNSLYAFICEYSTREYRKEGLPENLFRRLLKWRCLIMFDGMDEVEFKARVDVRSALEGLVSHSANSAGNIYLVTTRPSAAEVTSQLVGFETATVLPITPEKRERMIELWCNAVYPTLTEADDKASDLLRRIESPLVNEMATTPLMINIFALVYYHSRDLPSQRAELFEQAVKALLTDPHKQGQAAADTELWGGRPVSQRIDDMALIAYILHDEGKPSIFADDLLSREEFWRRFGDEKNIELAKQKASDFLELVARRGGLLRQDGKTYDFYIRRFREFLAGHYVAQKMEEHWDVVLQKHVHARGDQWIEPLLLSLGFLAYSNDNKAKKLMQALTRAAQDPERHNHAFTIAGIALADLLKNPTERVRGLFAEEKREFPAIMQGILEKTPPVFSADLRYRLGLALAEIGDPRFQISIENKMKFVMPQLVDIPAGVFRMGTSEEDEKIIKEQGAKSWNGEKPAHNVFLSEYSIGKYPVTNAEFRCFWEQDGYNPDAPWWSEDGRKWRTGAWESDLSWLPSEDLRETYKNWLAERPVNRRNRPFWWDDPKWNAANLPVVGITWFEMEAYCNWLSHVTSKPFRLPTEAEWEHAARGAENFIWSWGNTWDAERTNTGEAENKIGGTSPVGMYPHGVSPFGAQDMIGNVWEWCLDCYNDEEYKERAGKDVKDPCRVEGGNARVLRGGSWSNSRNLARCSVRRRYEPDNFDNSFGFRVVCSPSFPSLPSESLNSESLNRENETP